MVDYISISRSDSSKGRGMPAFMSAKLFSEAIDEVENNVQSPRPLVFMSALSVISLAIQASVDVMAPTGQLFPTSLMTLVIGNSGERKTSVMNKFLEPIREVQRQEGDKYKAELSRYELLFDVWAGRRRRLIKATADAKFAEDRLLFMEELEALEVEKPAPPVEVKFVYEDSTTQALFAGLYSGYPNAGLIASEGKEILSGRAFNDLPKQNSLWSGDEITIDRVSSPSFKISDARLVVSIMVQDGLFREYLTKRGDEARASGLWARFLVARPESTQGTRFIEGSTLSWRRMSVFNSRIKEIVFEGLGGYRDGNQRRVIGFTREASLAWLDLYNSIEREIGVGGKFERFSDHASKLMENISRVAALLSYFEFGDVDISKGFFLDAVEVCLWCSVEFKDIFVAPNQDEKDAKLLMHWLDESFSEGISKVRVSSIQNRGPNSIRRKIRVDGALGVLVEGRKVSVWEDGGIKFVGPAHSGQYRARRR
jgi:hypothetical protein